MIIRCPKCGREAPFDGNPFRPFCSERCRLVDLGEWLAGTYGVPAEREEEEEEMPARDDTTGEP
jgi:endogenous inhibitor of DNA gyrase (YacG/DUF329 family)